MARPPKHPVDVKLKIVLSVLQGESTQAQAARRHGVSETSIGKWREHFVSAGREGLSTVTAPASRPVRRPGSPRRSTTSPERWARRMSSCVRSSVAARPGWGFAELEALRVEHDLPVHRFCATVGLPVRTYYGRRARHRDGQPPRGPWPTPARDRVAEAVVAMALAFPMWGHRKIAWLCRHDGIEVSDATCLRVLRDSGLVLPVDYWFVLQFRARVGVSCGGS
ncbi:MAG: helix-turn-helix domain-containing protein [Actinobacteria bacterium]|nr:helix-turn-helix domain-containing protein [Actinomycetota bacterium]MCA1701664.1 helix-turn-helix domain-containing protein [Actinomycetota bacterium]